MNMNTYSVNFGFVKNHLSSITWEVEAENERIAIEKMLLHLSFEEKYDKFVIRTITVFKVK